MLKKKAVFNMLNLLRCVFNRKTKNRISGGGRAGGGGVGGWRVVCGGAKQARNKSMADMKTYFEYCQHNVPQAVALLLVDWRQRMSSSLGKLTNAATQQAVAKHS
jgi:hypothetical protein